MQKINFSTLSLKDILRLSNSIVNSSETNVDLLKYRFSKDLNSIENSLFFLSDLKLVKILDNKLSMDSKYKKIILNNDESEIKKYLRKQILTKSSNNTKKDIRSIVEGYIIIHGDYRYSPSLTDRLRSSGLRNLLIELNLLKFNSLDQDYIIHKELINFLSKSIITQTPSSLYSQIESQQFIGQFAEEEVYEHELKLLDHQPSLQKLVKHVSKYQVNAGFDIESIEKMKNGEWAKIFIEVKAVSRENWRFFWSRNEIQKAQEFGSQYFLYLVPIQENKPDILNLKKIKNPYKSVFCNNFHWIKKQELYSFFSKK